MSFMEIASFVLLLLAAVLLIFESIRFSVSFKNIKDLDPKVKVRNRNAFLYYVGMIMSVMFILLNSVSLSSAIDAADVHAGKAYIYCLFIWVAILSVWIACAVFSTSSYVTTDGIFTIGVFRKRFDPESVTYEFSGETLEIYCKKKRPAIYKVIYEEDKAELEELLKVHYKHKSDEPEKAPAEEKTEENEKENIEDENI